MNYKNNFFSSIVVFFGVVAVLLLSLIFSVNLEEILKLQPNLSDIENNALQVHFVDVGQGDAILIRFPDNKTMLVDSGPQSASKNLFNYIDNVFFKNDEKHFDFVMLTHSDYDHAGNMVEVLTRYKVDKFFRPQIYVKGLENNMVDGNMCYDEDENYCRVVSKLYELSLAGKLQVEFIKANTYVSLLNSSYMHILSPIKNYYSKTNEFSPIVVFEHKGVKFMLTGDATKENELEVMNNYSSSVLDCDVLKLAHHGSDTSTSYAFLEATSPKYAIISVGADNSYDHPSRETIDTIQTYNNNNGYDEDIKIKQTQNLGNIICYVNESGKVEFLEISDVDDYVFVDYYIIVICLIAFVAIIVFTPSFFKWIKQNKIKKIEKIKNKS